ncbi:MAG: STAS domain-containing protein [Methanoculleus horonobensis]|nr:STAS domain-containing protein [Methanoculleus horonobensis]MDD4251510.1 STAS domain-containing protein [Methanoculleus horonobensis]
MDCKATREGNVIVISAVGRLDGFGAEKVNDLLRSYMHENDSAVVVDMNGVDFMSSAGLRFFQSLYTTMRERNGRVAVAGLTEYPRKIFSMGGFLRVIEEFPDAGAALAALRPAGAGADEKTVSFTGRGRDGAVLRYVGSLRAAYLGPFTEEDITAVPASVGEYMVGIGAAAPDLEAAAPLVGEMLGIRGTVYTLPADGNETPDYLLPGHLEGGGITVASAFRAALDGGFSTQLTIAADGPEGITVQDIVEKAAGYLSKNHPGYTGVFSFLLRGTVRGICSADIRSSLLAAHRTAADAENRQQSGGMHSMYFGRRPGAVVADDVTATEIEPRYDGETLIAFGYAVDLERAGSAIDPALLEPLYYTRPGAPAAPFFIYAAGAVYTGVPYVGPGVLEDGIATTLDAGKFVALHHLLPISKLRNATVGIAPVTRLDRTA